MWKPPRREKPLVISLRSGAGHAAMTLEGTLDDLTVEKAERAFSKMFNDLILPKSVQVICTDLVMISSAGLAFLINALRICAERGIALHVTSASGKAKRAIDSIGMSRIASRLHDNYGVEVNS